LDKTLRLVGELEDLEIAAKLRLLSADRDFSRFPRLHTEKPLLK